MPLSCMLTNYHAKFASYLTYDTTSSLGSNTDTECPLSVTLSSLRLFKVRFPSSCMLTKHHAKFASDQTSDTTSNLGFSTDTKCPLVLLWKV